MARSPLLSLITRAHSLLRRSAREGVPAEDLLALDRERRALHRRRLLQAGLAAAAAIPFAGCEEQSAPFDASSYRPVAIVGGGIAGLHCAYRLKKLGVTATVYEASSRLGGRMFSDRSTFPDGMHCELGGELIDTGHATLHDLATELGIELLDYAEDDPTLADLTAYIGGEKMTGSDFLDAYKPIAKQIDEALATLTDPEDAWVYYNNPNGGEALDAVSIAEWLDAAGATGPIRTLLEVAFNIEYGLETDVSNALNMLLLIGTSTKKLELFGESDERYHTKDGNDTFITKLAAALDPSQIVLETPLLSIAEASDGRYALTFAQGDGTLEITTDHVVLALPFTKLRDLDIKVEMSLVKLAAIHELGMGTNAKLMCGFSSRPWRETYESNGATYADTGYQCTWETSRLQPGKSGILTNFTGGKPGLLLGLGSPEDQRDKLLAQLDLLYPGVQAASNGKVARMHWPTYAWTKGSYSAYLVGQYTRMSGAEIERVNNIHFCGEHTSIDAQGYMEGGALTGAMAADEIASDLGLSTEASAALHRGLDLRPSDRAARRILLRARAARTHRRWHAAAVRDALRGARQKVPVG